MKTLAALTVALFTTGAVMAQTAPAAGAAAAKPAAASPAAGAAPAPAPAPAKVDCKDAKNKDHADCKKK